jgi:hypothetical protein
MRTARELDEDAEPEWDEDAEPEWDEDAEPELDEDAEPAEPVTEDQPIALRLRTPGSRHR